MSAKNVSIKDVLIFRYTGLRMFRFQKEIKSFIFLNVLYVNWSRRTKRWNAVYLSIRLIIY